MKLLVLFCAVAVWLQMPGEGVGSKVARLDFSQFSNRRSLLESSEESEEGVDLTASEESEEGVDLTASEGVKAALRRMFSHRTWRTLILLLASPETMADPDFREKWSVTAADDEEKEAEDDDEDVDPELAERIESFFESNRWKALFALSSTKSELLDSEYREEWELGDLPTEGIADADEDGDFFQGPQWVAWLELTNKDIDDDLNDWVKAKILMEWIMDIGDEMMSLDDE